MEDSDQLIDHFLLGRLEGKALHQFQTRLEQDEQLASELSERKKALEVVDGFGDLEMMKTINQIHEEEKNWSPQPRILQWSVAAAVALLVLAGIWWWAKPAPDAQQLFAQYYQPYELSFTSRDQGIADALTQANSLYNTQKFQAAIPLFESIYAQDTEQSKVALALGICHLENKAYDKALTYFIPLYSKDFDLYKDQATWYAALVYLQQNNPEQAKSLLQNLSQRPAAHFHQKAKELLSTF